MDFEADPDDLIGKVLASRYCIEARLGHGAMGTVYRARHVKVGRAFAIKVLHPRFLADEKTRKRFAREAERAGSLHHPNIVSVVDAGETPVGLRYLVMDFIDGPTLYELIARTAPMQSARVIGIVRQLCEGLGHAHERGLIHRDFKTENVIVERDARGAEIPKIVDFGVAILRDEAASSNPERLTTAGLVLGTPHYMAPEHATGGAIDHRIDLFALGVMCFEMLTGRAPFDGDGVDVARANLLLDTPAMSERVPGLMVDPLLEALTRQLLMKSRDARPATARAVRDLIDLIERDRATAAAVLGTTREDPRAGIPATWAPTAPIPQLGPRQPVMQVVADARGTDPTQLALRAATIAGAARVGEPANALPSAPHHVARASESILPHPPANMELPQLVGEVTQQMAPVRSRRAAVAIAAVAALAVLIALVLALRPRRAARPVARPVAATPAIDAGVDVAAAKEPGPTAPAPMASAPAPSPVELAAPPPATPARSAARPAIAKPGRAPTTAAPTTDPPAPTEEPPTLPAVDEPAPPGPAAEPRIALSAEHPPPVATGTTTATPASVAQHYAAIGKQLKALDQARGSAATADLWLLYLRVRINDVIANPAKCAEADALLRYLDEELRRRSLMPQPLATDNR